MVVSPNPEQNCQSVPETCHFYTRRLSFFVTHTQHSSSRFFFEIDINDIKEQVAFSSSNGYYFCKKVS